jgi:malate dehydrogenase (oxaloacetate-decarboxylating)(NADP+)
MITGSAIALSEAVDEEEAATGLLYPRLTRIRDVSAKVAVGVIRAAQKNGVDTVESLRSMSDAELFDEVKKAQWSPYQAPKTSRL